MLPNRPTSAVDIDSRCGGSDGIAVYWRVVRESVREIVVDEGGDGGSEGVYGG